MSVVPEADRAGDAPHPRETLALFGQDAAERRLLAALKGDRLHHAWLLTGPPGIGKATLAWRFARALRAGGVADGQGLDLPADHPVVRRAAGLAEPGIFLLRRAWDEDRKRLPKEIGVDRVRELQAFFRMSASDGGARVAIVDAADDLNTAAANALLKLLEEPPAGAVLLLISHAPSRLLPTLRSRCLRLGLSPLGPEALDRALATTGVDPEAAAGVAALSGGSVGQAVRLARHDGAAIYADLLRLVAGRPMPRPALAAFTSGFAGRGAEDRLAVAVELLSLLLARLAAAGAGRPPEREAAPDEAKILRRLAPDPRAARGWAALAVEIGERLDRGLAVNIDPASLLTDALLRIDAQAVRAVA